MSWFKKKTPEAVQPKGCDHIWSEWTEPKQVDNPIEKTTSYGYGGHTTNKMITPRVQERKCKLCNIYDDRVVSSWVGTL